MNPVSPTKVTTLVLSAGFQPCGFITARSAIRNMMVHAVKAYDKNGNIYDWNAWIANDDQIDPDHPSLRSVSGEWAIPTIVIIPGYFGKHHSKPKAKRIANLKQLYHIYDGECQYCCKRIPYSSATRDHLLPRSKGGSNDDNNIVLSCKKCNLKKSNKFPYFNIHGSEVKPKMMKDIEFLALSSRVARRPEWETFL
jgi:hypothetical protein